MPIVPPYVPTPAVARGSDAVATLPATPYPRRLLGLTVNGTRGVSVAVYMGGISPSTRIDQNPNGWSNTADYAQPRPIPAGSDVNVVWPGRSGDAANFSCTFHQEAA